MSTINLPTAKTVRIKTEYGIARQVFIDDFEIPCATDVDIQYGISSLPVVKVTFYAKEVITDDERTAGNP